jgi:FHA domain
MTGGEADPPSGHAGGEPGAGRPPMRLEVVAGKAVGMSILVEDELVVGRHAAGAGRLAEDEEISRSHARITRESGGHCAIEDLGSTNGTFVNGLRIRTPQMLSEGDIIELGATTLAVRDLPPVMPPAVEDAAYLAHRSPPSGPGASPGVAPLEAPPGPPEAPIEAPEPPSTPAGPPAEIEASLRHAPPAGEDEAESPPALALRLEVDFAAAEARIVLGDESEPVRLVFEAGAWRPAPPPA